MPVESTPSEGAHFDRRRRHRRHEDRKLLQRTRELEAVRRICHALFEHMSVDELVESTLRTALDVVGTDAGTVLLADPGSRQLVFRYVIGDKAPLLVGRTFPWGQGLAGSVFQSGEPEVIADVKQDTRHLPDIDDFSGYRSRDMIVLPLKRWEGPPIGVLEVLNKREGRLDPDDLAILTIISALSAQMIERAQLYESGKLAEVARLLGDIGHDLRNMLQPVVMGADLLGDELGAYFTAIPETARPPQFESRKLRCDEVIEMIQSNTVHIQHRVKQIADCVKGLIAPPRLAPCEIPSIVEQVFKTVQVFAQERKVRLRTEGMEALPKVTADERLLFNAFYNLVTNALAETPEGGRVTVGGAVDAGDRAVILTVTDTGRGMPPEVVESLFTNRTISRKPGGTGLGTKIVKDVVEAHGGTVGVESTEGVGSTFTIRLSLT